MPVMPEPDSLRDQFLSHLEETSSLQSELLDNDLDNLVNLHNLTPHEVALSREYLTDLVSIFKYLRRAQYSRPRAKELILDTLLWRIGSSVSYAGTKPPHNSLEDRERLQGESLAHLRLNSLRTDEESPLHKGIFYFLPGAKDKFGRPVAVMRLRYSQGYGGDQLQGMKEYVALSIEVGRRLCWEETLKLWEEKGYGKDAVVRYSCILDLKGVGLSGMVTTVILEANI